MHDLEPRVEPTDVSLEHVTQPAEWRGELEADALALAERLEEVTLERGELVPSVRAGGGGGGGGGGERCGSRTVGGRRGIERRCGTRGDLRAQGLQRADEVDG